jgi:hypothetical protein
MLRVTRQLLSVTEEFIAKQIQHWLYMYQLPLFLIERYLDQLSWIDLIETQSLSDNIVRKVPMEFYELCSTYHKIPLDIIYPEKICWEKQIYFHEIKILIPLYHSYLPIYDIIKHMDLTDEEIELMVKYIPCLSWRTISKYQRLSDKIKYKYNKFIDQRLVR